MLFSVALLSQNDMQYFLISGSSWSDCLSYCETTGKEIFSISSNHIQNFSVLILNDSTLDYCFSLTLSEDSTNSRLNYFIFDTFENVLNWLGNQTGKSLIGLQKQNKQFVQI
jgi:hypothetical protein